jgi:hypothetical protein
MKKILIINAAILLLATAAYAGDNVTMTSDLASTSSKSGLTLYGGKNSGDAANTGDAAQKLIGKTSTGVSVGIKSSSLGYAIVTQHKQGIKAYGTSHDATAVYMVDAVKGTAYLAVPTAIGSDNFVTDTKWSSM